MGVESILAPFMQQAEIYGPATCLLGCQNCNRCAELLITRAEPPLSQARIWVSSL